MFHLSPRRVIATTLGALFVTAAVAVGTMSTGAASPPSEPKPTVVLVHGAFADASGWSDVVERLQKQGYPVIAPANPLRGLASDTAYIRELIDEIDGPVVIAAHSYGGAVVTNAAVGAPNVKALVYIAAFAPAEGESLFRLLSMNPGSRLAPDKLIFRHHPGGVEGYVHPDAFREVFAQDLPKKETAVMAATQRPGDSTTLQDESGTPAWQTIPSWYLVAGEDHLIPPATQRFMAERAGAITVEVDSSHVAMISQPKAAADLIMEAAAATD
jgi:pimeloyl-ACP methyl ester carboxylesterase